MLARAAFYVFLHLYLPISEAMFYQRCEGVVSLQWTMKITYGGTLARVHEFLTGRCNIAWPNHSKTLLNILLRSSGISTVLFLTALSPEDTLSPSHQPVSFRNNAPILQPLAAQPLSDTDTTSHPKCASFKVLDL